MIFNLKPFRKMMIIPIRSCFSWKIKQEKSHKNMLFVGFCLSIVKRSRLQNNKKSCFVGCFPGIWRECYPVIFFELPSKFYHLFYKKPSPSIPTSRESPVIAFLAPVQHGFGTLRAYHHRKKLQQADELIKAGRFRDHGKTMKKHQKSTRWYISHRIHVGKYAIVPWILWVYKFDGIFFCWNLILHQNMIEFAEHRWINKSKAPEEIQIWSCHNRFSQHKWVFWQGSETRGQLASREGYPDLEKQPTCGISRACVWRTHEILRKIILNSLAATKVVLSLYGLIMFMYPFFLFSPFSTVQCFNNSQKLLYSAFSSPPTSWTTKDMVHVKLGGYLGYAAGDCWWYWRWFRNPVNSPVERGW